LLSSGSADLAVDLGTARTRIANAAGLLLDEPTAIALHKGRSLAAFGNEALEMQDRAPQGVSVIRPIQGSVITDFDGTEKLLRVLLKQAGGSWLRGPRVLISVPLQIAEVERRAVMESARAAGAREVTLVATCMAAAVGVELPVAQPVGSILVDCGAGHTEVTVLSAGGVVEHAWSPVGGDAMDEAIVQWLARTHHMAIGQRTAEKVKRRIGCAVQSPKRTSMTVRGRHLSNRRPREAEVNTDDMAAALAHSVIIVRDVITATLQATAPELAADIHDRGLILCGGAAQLTHLDHVLRETTTLPILLAEQPDHAVVRGCARLLEDPPLLATLGDGS